MFLFKVFAENDEAKLVKYKSNLNSSPEVSRHALDNLIKLIKSQFTQDKSGQELKKFIDLYHNVFGVNYRLVRDERGFENEREEFLYQATNDVGTIMHIAVETENKTAMQMLLDWGYAFREVHLSPGQKLTVCSEQQLKEQVAAATGVNLEDANNPGIDTQGLRF